MERYEAIASSFTSFPQTDDVFALYPHLRPTERTLVAMLWKLAELKKIPNPSEKAKERLRADCTAALAVVKKMAELALVYDDEEFAGYREDVVRLCALLDEIGRLAN